MRFRRRAVDDRQATFVVTVRRARFRHHLSFDRYVVVVLGVGRGRRKRRAKQCGEKKRELFHNFLPHASIRTSRGNLIPVSSIRSISFAMIERDETPSNRAL